VTDPGEDVAAVRAKGNEINRASARMLLLEYLVAQNTTGAEVWRALFCQMLKAEGE
jgi:hypothetical protein